MFISLIEITTTLVVINAGANIFWISHDITEKGDSLLDAVALNHMHSVTLFAWAYLHICGSIERPNNVICTLNIQQISTLLKRNLKKLILPR